MSYRSNSWHGLLR